MLRGKQKLVITVVLVLLANALMGYLLHVDRLYGTQSSLNDLMLRNSGQRPDPRIVIAAIDDQSQRDLGRWPFDRARYAQLLARLKDDGAKVAAFDVAFIGPTQSDPVLAQGVAYAQSNANGTPPMTVIFAVVGDGQKGRFPGQGLAYEQFEPVSPIVMQGRPSLANVTVDPDGATVRHLPLRAVAGNQAFFLLPFAAVNAFEGKPPLDQQAKLLPDGIGVDDEFIPTDPAYRMLINFEGGPAAYPHYSMSKIISGEVPAEALKDKLVFVGELGSSNIPDNYPVPTSADSKMDGVEIWANGAQNILDGKFVLPEGNLSTHVLMVVLSVLAAAAFYVTGVLGWVFSLGIMLVYSGAAYLLTESRLGSAANAAQIIPLPRIAYVDGIVLLVGLVLFAYYFIHEQSQRKAINAMFGKYVTPEVAKHLMDRQEQGELKVGGSLKTATIMFGDIRGFTTISEGMEPEEVMAMLNRYFDRMVDIIMKHGGTISKFIGDNVMVLFNVPVESKDNHALQAARAGFEIQEWIKGYRAEHPEEQAAFGFGISSGELVAGIMGSEERQEYTVIGDPVREADELCATALANEVALSETTYELIKSSGVELEDRGMVTIKGKTEEIHMYVIRGLAPEPVAVA